MSATIEELEVNKAELRLKIRSFNDTFDRIEIKEAHLEAKNKDLKANQEDSRDRHESYLANLRSTLADKVNVEERLAEAVSNNAAKDVVIALVESDYRNIKCKLADKQKAHKAVCLDLELKFLFKGG